MTCGRVVIINKGRVVAEGTPDDLMHRLRGAAALKLEVRGDAGRVAELVRTVPGVATVRERADQGIASLEVDAEAGRDVRPDLARAVVQGGFDLLAMQEMGMSLEQIFLHLTTSDPVEPTAAAPALEPAKEATA
jgi:ABC-2 type transport system ATP-binding protein